MTSGTWSIPPAARRIIARWVLELRAALEDDFRRQLAALGIREGSIQPLPAGRTLAPPDQRAREVASAVIEREVQCGATRAEALEVYVRESAFTFLDRAVGLRCLDERGLLLVDGQRETAIKLDPARGASSLYWRVRNELSPSTAPREVWRETLRRAGAAISEQIRVLFDPESEYAALLPLQPTLQKVVDGLNTPEIPAETYAQDELLGWVYQYYQSQEKDAAYARLAKGKKLERPEELAAATCLYTERYMVDYLLQNTLGALWVELHPDSKLPEKWPYYVKPPLPAGEGGGEGRSPLPLGEGQGEGSSPTPDPRPPAPAAKPLRAITLTDPACGSGHFLVRAFDLLVDMYREEGREPESEIPHLILERNLHGIDIDARSVQIAALALYLKACELAGPSFRPRRLNLLAADAVLPGEEPPAEYLARFADDPTAQAVIRSIWQGLKNVREFGSLLHPERAVDEAIERFRAREQGTLFAQGDAEWQRWKLELLAGLREEFERQARSEDLGQRLFGEEAAKGIGLVEALSRTYDVAVMNPPYAGGKNLSVRLRAFVDREYKVGKQDLYAAFIQRSRELTKAGGFAATVTPHSAFFMSMFGDLRSEILTLTTVTSVVQLGRHAFSEADPPGTPFLLCVRNSPPTGGECVAAFRLAAPMPAARQAELLREAIAGQHPSIRSWVAHDAIEAVPGRPFVYWLRPKFFDLLKGSTRLGDFADVKEGLGTRDDERFLRAMWEVSRIGDIAASGTLSGRWFWCAKAGRYQRWAGLMWVVVDWEDNGRRIREFPKSVIRNPSYQFRRGLTYNLMARGKMGVRLLDGAMFNDAAPSIFVRQGRSESPTSVASLCNTHVVSYLLRTTTQDLKFRPGYVANLPLPSATWKGLATLGQACIDLKLQLVSLDPLERGFHRTQLEVSSATSLGRRWADQESRTGTVEALLHAIEGLSERSVCQAYGLDEGDVEVVLDETETPVGWHPLIAGYDAVPEPPTGITFKVDLAADLTTHDQRALTAPELARPKARLRVLYQAGPGAKHNSADDVDEGGANGDEDEEPSALGARIPIPTETFLEELSQKLEIHPISVYWLLKEMREQEGLVSPPLLKQSMEDYASVSILRLLGYRWPEQDKYEEEHGPILDPALVDEDGIIPLVPCADQPTAEQRVRTRLERDFGEDGAATSELEFRQWVGRDLGDWLRRDFFKRHVQQFKQRPIAWHLVSPERTFEAFVLYHKLSRATLQKLRAQYAGGLIARLRAEQERARQRGATAEVSKLQLHIEDVEEFRARLEKIERGDELKYRVRCRWKDEEDGRPGPYAPDIDDGVKVNIRPFQEAGLLALREVIKKW